jgi:pimeloyl-ACP methyl ester carboxylesterase
MPEHAQEIIPFTTDDGRPGNVIHVIGDSPPSRGPVMLVHGAGVRANIFRAPVETTLVDDLLAHGWDVWLENWRASIDFTPCEWNLDQAAVYDHPRAVETVIAATGTDTMQAVIHCQGSTSFMMSAVAGLVPQVTTIVSNAVALHPVIPPLTSWKQRLMTPIVAQLMPYLDPQWDVSQAPGLKERAIALWVQMTHRECHNQVCKMVSFTYGMGHPTLWSHANLNDATHEWLRGEFGNVPLSFFRQIMASVHKGHLVSVAGLKQLPADFVAQPPETDARFAFLSGARNHCFIPESQQRTFEYFNGIRPGYHSIRILPLYGHLDVFMGERAATDVFPLIRQELLTPAGRPQ